MLPNNTAEVNRKEISRSQQNKLDSIACNNTSKQENLLK